MCTCKKGTLLLLELAPCNAQVAPVHLDIPECAIVCNADAQVGTEAIITADTKNGTEAVATIDAEVCTETVRLVDAQMSTEAMKVYAQAGTDARVWSGARVKMETSSTVRVSSCLCVYRK